MNRFAWFIFIILCSSAAPASVEVDPFTGGNGDVVGPVTATDNSIPRFDGTTGKAIKASSDVIIDDTGKVGVGTSTPGQKLTVEGTLGILEGGGSPSFHTIFQGGNQSGNITYTLPVDDGDANEALTTDGSGVLSWAAAGASPSIGGALTGATAGSVIFAGSGTFAQDNANLFWDDAANRLGIGTASPASWLNVVSGATEDAIVVSGGDSGHPGVIVNGTNYPSIAVRGNGANGGGIHLESSYPGGGDWRAYVQGNDLRFYEAPISTNQIAFRAGGNVGVGSMTPAQKLTVEGTIGILEGGGTPSFHTILQGGDQAGDVTYTLPVDDGTANQFLQTDGAGVLAWAAPSISLTTQVTGILPIANGGTNKALTLAAGGLVWTDADSFEVSAAGTSQQWSLSGGTGAPTFSNTTTTGKIIDGSADEPQLTIEGAASQTVDEFVVQASGGADHLAVQADGAVIISETGGNGGNVPHIYERSAGADSGSTTCTDTCAAGTKVVGGGCASTGSLALLQSYPSSDTVWSCEFAVTTTNCVATAICFAY